MKKLVVVLALLGAAYLAYRMTRTTSLDPCKLLTKQEIEAAYGVQLQEPKSLEGPKARGCIYNVVSEPGRTITIMGQQKCDFGEFTNGMSQDKSVPTIPGIGDEAIEFATHLLFRKNDVCMGIDTDKADADPEMTARKNLALKAMERLPR